MLTGKYLPDQPVPAGSLGPPTTRAAPWFIGRILARPEVLPRVQKLRPVADELGISMAQLAVAWVLQNPNVASAIIGASRPEQVTENVKASGVVIPPELMKRIDKVLGDSVVHDPAETALGAPGPR